MGREIDFSELCAGVIQADPEEMYKLLRFAIEENNQKHILCVLDAIAKAYDIVLSGDAYIVDEDDNVTEMLR